MRKELIEPFLKKRIKLVRSGYALYGEILELGDDYLIFKSKEMTGVISLDIIEEIAFFNVEREDD